MQDRSQPPVIVETITQQRNRPYQKPRLQAEGKWQNVTLQLGSIGFGH
ncbi:hypothetical protein [Deinococcus cellulosilyticus]|uniref:Uncharacterized protein n=1 Tax=Deinococcus cellulosilyticus (strain DSM 18568 / NBRC 106333 / KACC 11606 / 5516J-15) TaxID=1223518 RepID=A0A511N3T4_DEIC1|nr:hypothetical protein [Deinococcus cellulosilyticus]GEM47076.1 hypothetical protein DC3_27110 [Deinococcus cellulosilyticus NBRC 106333 = KACC 11606]